MVDVTLPKPLDHGARIGVFALAGAPDPVRLQVGLEFLRSNGLVPVVADNVASKTGYLAGDDHARVAGLRGLLDQGVDALLAARGGYGTMRVLEDLPWPALAAFHGWIVGFSDLTALHAALSRRGSVATLHGPVATSLAREGPARDALIAWLRGAPAGPLFRLPPGGVLRGGLASGRAIGGNLSILAALVGTEWEPDYDGAVLFLEDVGEPLFRLDRLLTQLRLSSRLDRVCAIVAGSLHRCGRGEIDGRRRWLSLLAEAAPVGAVVVAGLPFGHGARNMPFPLGCAVTIDTAAGVVKVGGG